MNGPPQEPPTDAHSRTAAARNTSAKANASTGDKTNLEPCRVIAARPMMAINIVPMAPIVNACRAVIVLT